jgi:hypothetical protein
MGAALSLSGIAHAQQSQPGTVSDQDYMQEVMKAAPRHVVEQATIVRMDKGEMRTVKKGTNEFTCMVPPAATAMCLDPDAMNWAQAWQSHSPPPDKTGFIYMLAGDTGAATPTPGRRNRSRTTTGFRLDRTS